jgi:hypothetical protein
MGSLCSTLAVSMKSGAKAPFVRAVNVAAEAATHKPVHVRETGLHSGRHIAAGEMFYQVSWTTLPGLRGLSCSEFRATLTAAPDNERGVAVDCATDAERDALLAELEAHFGPRRFLNAAAAFDGVKDYIVLRAAGR